MKHLFTCLFLSLACFASGFAQYSNSANMSPFTRIYLAKMEQYGKEHVRIPGYVYKRIDGKDYVSGMIKVSSNPDAAMLDVLGVKVGTRAGNIWTVQIPAGAVSGFVVMPGLEYVQLDEPMAYALDSARVTTHADSAQAGINLPMPFTGKDVLVGIIDAGFDYHHPTFFDTSGTRFRVRKVWEQKTVGTPPSGFGYGNELVDSNAMWAAGTDNNTFSHGSHVAGIAGGSGFGGDSTNRRFRGMAPESDLAFVGIMPDPTEWVETGVSDVIDGMNYLYTYANSISKPCVVNLSWGTTLGPHDGTSLFSQACDNITGPGKIFVLAAGNNGGQRVHLKKTFTNTDTLVNTRIGFDPALGTNKTWVDIWGDQGQQFCVKLTIYNGLAPYASSNVICLDNNVHTFTLVDHSNDTVFVTVTTSSDEFNHKTRAFIDISSQSYNFLTLGVTGTSGTVNMWEGYVANGHGYYGQFSTINNLPAGMAGDADYTVGDIADTKSAITAAAYTSKNIYTGVNNTVTNYTSYASLGAIAPFSSTGPTIDGRVKPDIAAPGLILGSAVNSYDTGYHPTGPYYSDVVNTYHNAQNNRDYGYGMMMGTSMASPATAGIVALLLEANPNLKPESIRMILNANAIQDSYTGVIPAGGSTVWGGGKINAYRSVLDAVNHVTGLARSSNNAIQCIVYPNPGNGDFNLAYYGNNAEQLKVDVQDIAGRIIMETSWNVTAGYNTRALSLKAVPKGIYFTRVFSVSGSAVIKTVVE